MLWSRALSEAEVAERAHAVPGGAPACEVPPSPPPPSLPTDRCTIGQAETTPTISTSVRFLSASLLVVISDPTGISNVQTTSLLQSVQSWHLSTVAVGRRCRPDFLHDQIQSRCGESLLATEEQYGGTTDWCVLNDQRIVVVNAPCAHVAGSVVHFCCSRHLNYEYMYAAMEIVDELRPPILAALSRSDGISIHAPDGSVVTPVATHLWPQVSREMRVRAADSSDFWHHVQTAEVQFFTYIELDHDLPDNVVYSAVDAFGNSQEFSYSTETSISFALKVPSHCSRIVLSTAVGHSHVGAAI